jgi:hypothetical protein
MSQLVESFLKIVKFRCFIISKEFVKKGKDKEFPNA